MNMAREFGRPDWRTMLAGLSSTELNEWADYFNEHIFHDVQLDFHFARLGHLIFSVMYPKHQWAVDDFRLLTPVAEPSEEMTDDQLLMAREGLSGGLRFEPARG